MEDVVSDLRSRILADAEEKLAAGEYVADDVDLCKSEDWFLAAFVRRYASNVDAATAAVKDCLKWRKENDVRGANKDCVLPALEKGIIYFHGSDKNEVPLLWLIGKVHKKGELLTKELLLYWLEKHYFQHKASQRLVIVLDLSSCGLWQLDLDAMRFLYNCMKYYYPGILEYLLVYEIPWILNAGWKIVKGWLEPVARKMIIFVNESDVKEYIEPSQLPAHMGGTDEYVFNADEAS